MKSITNPISISCPTPELHRGPFFVWDYEHKSHDEIATLAAQEDLIQTAADNPYGFATLDECTKAISPYLYLPVEEEALLDDIVSKLREVEKTAYTYGKDEKGNPTPKKVYDTTVINSTLFDLLEGTYLSKKYGRYASSIVRSWKSSKNRDNARNNVRKHLKNWAKEFIWDKGWKQTHRQGIRDNVSNKIINILSVPTALQLPTDMKDLEKHPPRPTDFKTKPKKKRFDKRSLTSLFSQTGDAELDNLLQEGREYVEDASFFKPELKPGQILLRKRMEDNEFSEPYMCEFKVMKPKYLQKHFPYTN